MGSEYYINNKMDIGLFSTALLFCISFIGPMYPYGFPLFGIFALLLTLYTFVLNVFNKDMMIIPRKLILLYLLELYYIFAILVSDSIYYGVRKDIINIIGLDLFIFSFFYYIKDIQSFKKFQKHTIFILFFASLFVSIIGLCKFTLLLKGITIERFISRGKYAWGTSLVNDYNSYAFSNIVGALCSIFILKNSNKIILRFFSLISFILITLNVFFSGSRRGLVILSIIVFYLIIYIIFKIWKNPFSLLTNKKFKKKRIYNFLVISLIIIVCIISLNNINIFRTNRYRSLDMQKIIRRYKFVSVEEKFERMLFSRTKRFNYSLELLNESSFLEILFGGGFDYLGAYGRKFKTERKEGYPHNLVISGFLYGGLFNLFFLLLFLFQSMGSYIKKFKDLKLFFIWFLIFLVFSMASGNTFFSAKRLLLLSVIPFITMKSISSESNQLH